MWIPFIPISFINDESNPLLIGHDFMEAAIIRKPKKI